MKPLLGFRFGASNRQRLDRSIHLPISTYYRDGMAITPSAKRVPTMPSRIQRCEPPNRIVLAIFGLLAVMAVSILVAIRFPYVDLNAQALLDAERAAVADNSGVVVAGGVGGVGVGVAHALSDFEDGDIAETVGVGVGGAGSGGGVEADTLVDDLPAETKSSEDSVISDYVPIDATISVTESMGAPSQNNDDGNQGVVDGEVVSC